MGALAGAVIAITGAGRGIGREVALLAAREGAKVVVNDLGSSGAGEGTDEAPAREVVDLIRSDGGTAVASFASVADPVGARSVVETAVRELGRLDAVVNNAGILRDAIFHKMSEADWEAVRRVHLDGAFHVSRAAAEVFRAQGSGAFVHMTSTTGLIGNVGQANYAAAKMGVVGLSRAIAIDMARFGVRSNCVAPFAWSRLTGALPAATETERARVERFREMSPASVAPLVVLLASELARDVTGQIFGVRANEVFLYSQPRPIRAAHNAAGWTAAGIAERVLPSFRAALTPLEVSGDVFPWDPM